MSGFNRGDRVSLTDARGTHYGTVQELWLNGLLSVRWDSGALEKCTPEELTKIEGAPQAEAPRSFTDTWRDWWWRNVYR